MNDELTSVEFRDDCAAYYSVHPDLFWDLDRDGSFETTGIIVTFKATDLDGPSDVEVPVKAVHPTDGLAGHAKAPVHVFNVAPTVRDVSPALRSVRAAPSSRGSAAGTGGP